MSRNEKETRKQLIDPKLELAGWSVDNIKGRIAAGTACIETPVRGMPKTSENPSGNGFVDYVMFGDNGKPLALIEAKKSVNNEEIGRTQAVIYADCLERQYGIRPIIYYTNGYSIKIIDGVFPPREVFGFHRKDELEYLIQRRHFNITDDKPDSRIVDRYYQNDAIKEVLSQLANKHARSLIVLATGTGKTRVSCALSDILLRNNYVKRILFLADRKNLVVQAKEETFEKFLPTVPMATIIEGKVTGSTESRVIFSTYQSMLSMIKDTSSCPFGIGHFDLIIVDEAHRSLFNKYVDIFSYFDSLMVGLTATPRNDIHKSTYKVFNIDNELPNYEYDLVLAVKDGYLRYFRALDRTADILKNGVTYADLSPEEQEEYEDQFTEEDGTIPEKIEGKEFYSVITNKDTIRVVLKDLMEEGLKVKDGDVLGKTIIFARDHNHAIMIQEEFRRMYPELCIPDGKNGVDYCVVIDNKIKYNEVLQREFKYGQDIRIVVSVDMMDTGVDVPEIVNLVFFKRVLSKIKFWQMIGRGTRTCEDIDIISPSKAYFERQTNDATRQHYKEKQGFLIFDVCDVFPFFKQNPDGREDRSDNVLSLNQRIYLEKVALFKAMQYHYSSLSEEEQDFYANLRDYLVEEVKNLNSNYIGVQKNLKYVEKYSDIANWLHFTQQSFLDIKKHIAPNINGEIDMQSARMFDLLAYKFSASRISSRNNVFAETAKTIYKLVNYLLLNKTHIEEVDEKREDLEYIVSDDFLNKTSVIKMESLRVNIRDLMRYIEKEVMEPIITDFNDVISSTEDAEDEDVDFSVTVDDFKSFDEKVIYFAKTHSEKALIQQIQNLRKPTAEAIAEMKEDIRSFAKDDTEYKALFPNDESLVIFLRKKLEISQSAIQLFITKEKSKGFTDRMCAYAKELLTFTMENGTLHKEDLLRDELNFGDLFDSKDIQMLLSDIEDIL